MGQSAICSYKIINPDSDIEQVIQERLESGYVIKVAMFKLVTVLDSLDWCPSLGLFKIKEIILT